MKFGFVPESGGRKEIFIPYRLKLYKKNPITTRFDKPYKTPGYYALKIQIELKKGPGIKKINFLTSLVNNYKIKKILWRFVNKLLDDKTVGLDVEKHEYQLLLEFDNYIDIEIIE